VVAWFLFSSLKSNDRGSLAKRYEPGLSSWFGTCGQVDGNRVVCDGAEKPSLVVDDFFVCKLCVGLVGQKLRTARVIADCVQHTKSCGDFIYRYANIYTVYWSFFLLFLARAQSKTCHFRERSAQNTSQHGRNMAATWPQHGESRSDTASNNFQVKRTIRI
jgi:hypothetical protein